MKYQENKKNHRNRNNLKNREAREAHNNRMIPYKNPNLNKNTMWIYGKHSVQAVIQNSAREILRLILLDTNQDFLNGINLKVEPEYVDKAYFASLFGKDATHQGCAVLVKKLKRIFLEDVISDNNSQTSDSNKDNLPIIFLDQVSDPQNIGSVLRAAAVLGARAVVITEDHSPEITPAIAKAASGALEEVPLIKVVSFAQSIDFLKKHGYWVVGLDEKSKQNLSDIDLQDKFVFVIGNEGYGMRRLTQESCDFIAKLPGVTTTFTTLNAAQAATVSLYESCRQRMISKPL